MRLAAMLFIGLFAGLLSGVFGIGGGLVIVPALVLGFNFSQMQAVATSLAGLLLPVGLFAVLEYHRRGLVDWRAAGLIAVGITLGVWLSARFITTSPTVTLWLPRAFGALLIGVGIRFLFR
jgi:uncharacterized membrane protein YfcA